MTIGLSKNQKYENWLKANKYEEGMIHGNSMSIVREDGNDIWTDDSGHSFKALCEQKVWEAGYNEGRQFTLEELLMIAAFVGPKEIPTETVEGKNKLVDKIRMLIEKESK